MTSPEHLAHLSTSARSRVLRMLKRTRLNDAIEVTGEERTAARKGLHSLNHAIDRARVEQSKLDADSRLFPPSAETDEARAKLGEHRTWLAEEHRYASALAAAADIVHASVRLERAWLDRPDARRDGNGYMLAALLQPFQGRVVNAPGYKVVVFHPDPHSPTLLWREIHDGTVNRSRARSMLTKWSEREQTYVLRDPHGRLYVTAPMVRLELTPTDIAPPHTEGDALRAALAAYGFQAYDDGEGGHTWLVVPLDRDASEDEMFEGPHFRINSSEHVDRPASQHDERWSASFFDGIGQGGEYITTLDPAPTGSTLAEDCAYIARAIADFEPLVAQD
ncbi:hypothetical protein ACPCSC_30240 [Streptomyces lavendulocolor]|uniref:hypothetical protein n=1 Tax=Streptomyces lavendulocolor TaxID=67316 RepID=UPI003C2C0006